MRFCFRFIKDPQLNCKAKYFKENGKKKERKNPKCMKTRNEGKKNKQIKTSSDLKWPELRFLEENKYIWPKVTFLGILGHVGVTQ